MRRSPEEPAGDAHSHELPAGSSSLSSGSGVVVVTSTLPTRDDADRIARLLVEERLAACVQCAGPIESTYRWQGQVERSTEWYVHCKTAAARAEALLARLRALHPYDVPEIIVTPVLGGNPAYLDWVKRESE